MKSNRSSQIAVVGGLFLMLSSAIGGGGMFINSRMRFYIGLAIMLIGVAITIRERNLRN